MKKGEDGYKSLCAALDRSQPHVKEQLDRTSTEEGATSLLFVNKQAIERQHSDLVTKKEKVVRNLEEDIIKLKEELELKEEALTEARKANEETTKTYNIQLEEEKTKFVSSLKKERNEKTKVTVKLREYDREVQQLKKNVEHLNKVFSDKKETLEALRKLENPDDNGCEQTIERKETASKPGEEECVLNTQEVCDVSQLMLLPCLHAACKPCINHHTDRLGKRGRLLCPCGCDLNLKVEDMTIDHVRRNEAAYNASKTCMQSCTYKDHEHTVDAVSYCHECEDYLCAGCQTSHDERRKNRGHKRDDIQEIEHMSVREWLKAVPCQEHPNHELELYDNNCRKAICILCSHGSHKHSNNEDLMFVYQQRKTALLEQLGKHQSQLKAIEKLTEVLQEHQNQLYKTASSLEAKVASVHQDIATKFLRRQKQLLQDIRLSLEGPKQAVQEKLKTVRGTEKSVNSTIDYINKILESTREAELISLSDAVEVTSADLLKTEFASDDTRDTKIRLTFQGHRALEEIIDEFGSVATCLNIEKLTDSHPTIRDMRCEMARITECLTFTRSEVKTIGKERIQLTETLKQSEKTIENSEKDKKQLKDDIMLKDREIEENKMMMRTTENRMAELQQIHCLLQQGPPMILNKERVIEDLHVSEDKLELTNVNSDDSPEAGPEARFQFYSGTCSSFVIPLSPSTIAQYWETNSRIHVKAGISWMHPLLEMGVCEEGQIDTGYWISEQRRSWCVRVVACKTHQPGICTQVCGEEKENKCVINTVPNTPGTETEVQYGAVLDAGRGILVFLDLVREVLLHKFDVVFRQPLVPLFGVHLRVSDLDRSGSCELKMRLVSGQDIRMTEKKKSLIHRALTSL